MKPLPRSVKPPDEVDGKGEGQGLGWRSRDGERAQRPVPTPWHERTCQWLCSTQHPSSSYRSEARLSLPCGSMSCEHLIIFLGRLMSRSNRRSLRRRSRCWESQARFVISVSGVFVSTSYAKRAAGESSSTPSLDEGIKVSFLATNRSSRTNRIASLLYLSPPWAAA